jgi:hypothetical protein
MIPNSRTSIVYNNPSKLLDLPDFYYRVRSCDTNLTSNTPANQYQRLKLIQNTVRVYASLYTANLGPLSAYQKPGSQVYNVGWNQMSDRPVPSVQKTVVPTGTNCTLNRRHTSVTSSRPGCQSPGGVGCDIKHNSYDRYLNRLKGRGPLRRGVVPPGFGTPVIPFNPAYPVYGAKTVKTNIVTGCNCPDLTIVDVPVNGGVNNAANNLLNNVVNKQDPIKQAVDNEKIYNNPFYQPYPSAEFSFEEGEYVFAIDPNNHNIYTRAIVQHKYNNLMYLVQFDNGVVEIQSINSLLPYYPCNCGGQVNSQTYSSGFIVKEPTSNMFYAAPLYPEYVPNQPVL